MSIFLFLRQIYLLHTCLYLYALCDNGLSVRIVLGALLAYVVRVLCDKRCQDTMQSASLFRLPPFFGIPLIGPDPLTDADPLRLGGTALSLDVPCTIG